MKEVIYGYPDKALEANHAGHSTCFIEFKFWNVEKLIIFNIFELRMMSDNYSDIAYY